MLLGTSYMENPEQITLLSQPLLLHIVINTKFFVREGRSLWTMGKSISLRCKRFVLF